MAAIPLLTKKEAQWILKMLAKGHTQSQAMHDKIALEKRLCSTATFFRRLKELQYAGYVRQRSKGHYELTTAGAAAAEQVRAPGSWTKLRVTQVRILTQLREEEYTRGDLRRSLSMSPNTLVRDMRELTKQGLIEETGSLNASPDEKKSKGRPAKKWALSNSGIECTEQAEELFSEEELNATVRKKGESESEKKKKKKKKTKQITDTDEKDR